MRPTRVIYVENDPALRGIVTKFLRHRPELEVLLSVSNGDDLVTSPAVRRADVALLDLALGPDTMNGIDLGIALRETNPNIGIVIHSQHSLDHLSRRVPKQLRIGWSVFPKSGDINMDDLVSVLRTTARGIAVGGDFADSSDGEQTALSSMKPRQRAVMALASTGLSSSEIANRLGITHDSVRQDLSKAYKQLVPNPAPGDDLRTRAILVYLQIVRDEAWDES